MRQDLSFARWAPPAAAALAFALYLATLAPDLLWSDSAKLLIQAARGELVGYGHGRHPLHVLLGMAFLRLPVPAPCALNLLSAVAGALAVGLTAAAATRLAGPWPGLLAGLGLAVSHTFWHYSVITESYALLWAALAAASCAALAHSASGSRSSAAALGLAAGLGLAAHGTAALTLPGLLWLARPRWRSLTPAGFGLLAGSVLIWLPALLPVAATAPSRETLGVLASTSAHAEMFLRPGKLVRELGLYPVYLGFQWPGVGLVALALGLRRLWREDRRLALGLLAAAAPMVAFASAYFRQRQFAMLGASYVLLAPLVALGLRPLAGRRRALALAGMALLVVPPALYAGAAELAARRGLPIAVRQLPLRDEARYFLWPPKQDTFGARRYVTEAALRLPRGATLIADFNAGEPLRWAIELERSLDLRLLEVIDDFVWAGGDPADPLADLIERELALGHSVFLADRYEPYYRVAAIGARFELSEVGPFLRVRSRSAD